MTTHQHYKFTFNGTASLTLPDGMCLDHKNRSDCDYSFQLISPDGRLRLYIEFFTSQRSAKELIEELNDPAEHEIIFPPCAIKTPAGSEGYIITYAVGKECYEECTLDLGGDVRINFWFLRERGKPCDLAFYEQVKNRLLENIKIV